MTDGGPAKWRPDPHPMMPGPQISTEEDWYNRGVAEGRRYERADKLLVVATAAMQGILSYSATTEASCSMVASNSFNFAQAMLAEADGRRDETRDKV